MLAVSQHSDQFDGLVILSDTTRFLEEPGERVYLDTYIDHYDERIEKAVVAFTPEPDVAHICRWASYILCRADPIMAVRQRECRMGLDVRPRLGEIAVPTLIVCVCQGKTCSCTHLILMGAPFNGRRSCS